MLLTTWTRHKRYLLLPGSHSLFGYYLVEMTQQGCTTLLSTVSLTIQLLRGLNFHLSIGIWPRFWISKQPRGRQSLRRRSPQIPVQIISKSMPNTNVDLTEHPNLQKSSQSSENTNIFLKLLFFSLSPFLYGGQNIPWLPLVFLKSCGNIWSFLVHSPVEQRAPQPAPLLVYLVPIYGLCFAGSLPG